MKSLTDRIREDRGKPYRDRYISAIAPSRDVARYINLPYLDLLAVIGNLVDIYRIENK